MPESDRGPGFLKHGVHSGKGRFLAVDHAPNVRDPMRTLRPCDLELELLHFAQYPYREEGEVY